MEDPDFWYLTFLKKHGYSTGDIKSMTRAELMASVCLIMKWESKDFKEHHLINPESFFKSKEEGLLYYAKKEKKQNKKVKRSKG